MQPSRSTAAFGSVFKIADLFPEPSEVIEALLFFGPGFSTGGCPFESRRFQSISVAQPSSSCLAISLFDSKYVFLASAIMASACSMRSFFFRPVEAGLQFRVRQHIYWRYLAAEQGIVPLGLFQLFFQPLQVIVSSAGQAGQGAGLPGCRAAQPVPAAPICNRSCGRPPGAWPPGWRSSARSSLS